MFAAALALILIGLLLIFILPWAGFIAAAVGLVLLVAFLLGIGRRATRDAQP